MTSTWNKNKYTYFHIMHTSFVITLNLTGMPRRRADQICDQLTNTSHNAPVPYPTMHYSVQKCAHIEQVHCGICEVKLLQGRPCVQYHDFKTNLELWCPSFISGYQVTCIDMQDINTLIPGQMDAISQTQFSSSWSWKKIFKFRFKFHWSLNLRVQ